MTGDLSPRDIALLRAIDGHQGHSVATYEAWRPYGTERQFWQIVFVFEATGLMSVERWTLTAKGLAEVDRAAVEGKAA